MENKFENDAISRQAMLNGLASIAKAKARSDAQKALMGRVMYFTEQLPPATPKQRTGHWINDENIIGCYYCSECGGYNNSYDDAYCKYCGAKMEGDNNGN